MLSYSLSGKGELVVLLHGLFGNKRNLSLLARELGHDYRVCSIDLPNHGDSPVSENMRFETMAMQVFEVVNSLDREDPIRILGHSLGGKVAMEFALLFPDRVSHLLVEDIAPVEYPPHHRELLDAILAIDLEALESRAVADTQLVEAIPETHTRQFVLTNLRKVDGVFQWKANMRGLSDCYPAIMQGLELRGRQPFGEKVMFIAGSESRYITAEMSEAIHTLFPGAQFRQIAGAGHLIHAEKPQVFNAQVKRFFSL